MPGRDVFGVYALLALAGIGVSAALWSRLARRGAHYDSRLTIVYFAGLIGAILGAKLAFLFAEGWHYRDEWVALLSGRSITGGLLGGYVAVEIAKRRLGYARATGDVFAIVVPLSLALGRVGCLLQGCCPGVACDGAHWWALVDHAGVARWPAAAAELIFNVVFLGWAAWATRRAWCPGNRFHVYLIAYGLFRFAHEFARDTVSWGGIVTGYQVIALGMAAFGAVRFMQRRREAWGPGVRIPGIDPT
ncbi:MAG: prolipoprotein diacylglyceryl transferase [Phycisphaerales bacterium]|nr:prolipoprotein diacylglyceryl transferase [Phycisphaerales bacterium]